MGIFSRKQTVASVSSFDNRCVQVDISGGYKRDTGVSKYVYEGCEFVGNYVDQKIRLAYKAPLEVLVGETKNNSLSVEYRALLRDLKRAMRLYLIHGEVFWVYLDQNVWYPVSPSKVKRQGEFYIFTEGCIPGHLRRYKDEVKRVFNPHDDNPSVAYTEFSRVMPDIIRYWEMQDQLFKNAQSQSLNYGGVWLGPASEEVAYYAGTQDGVASEVSDNQDVFGEWLKKKKTGADTAILYEGPVKPEPFILSELMDERAITQKNDCLNGFARGVNWPRALLVEGEGQGKYANEELLQRAAYENYVVPFLDDFAERMTVAFFTGTMRFSFGWDMIVERDSKIELLIEAKKAGVIIDDNVILEELGVETDSQVTAVLPQSSYVDEEKKRAEGVQDTWEQGLEVTLLSLWGLRKKQLKPAQVRKLEQLPVERRFSQSALDTTLVGGLTVAQNAQAFMNSPQAVALLDKNAAGTVKKLQQFLVNPVTGDSYQKMFVDDVRATLTFAERDASHVLSTPERARAILDSDGGLFQNIVGTTSVKTYRWVHGFLRSPIKPYPSHLERDGMTGSYDTITSNGSVRPQDHKYCTCVLVPEE